MNTIWKYARTALLVSLVLALSAGAAAAAQPKQEPGPLFEEIAAPAAERMAMQDAAPSLRHRFVNLHQSTLEAAQPGESLSLNLFDDVVLQADIRSVEQNGATTLWVGDIAGVEMGQAFIVANQGQVAIDVSMPEGLYQVRYNGEAGYAIRQIDQAAYPEEATPIEINLPAAPEQSAGQADESLPGGQADSGSVITVLVGYTPAARDKAGGTTGIQNLINLAVAETNQSYANSGINQRLSLAYVTEVAYTESGDMSTDLTRLQNASDGQIDQLHSLRNTYHADLVNLIIESAQYCGIAYHMSTLSSGFESYGFSVVARDCATGYYSFAHELGHNMGARHDWYVDNNTTPQSYAHGYVNSGAKWRTIMAYNDECSVRGINCTRLQYWANPAVLYGDKPMGVSAGSNTACALRDKNHPACDADDHRTLNDSAYVVANFRASAAPITTPFWQAPHFYLLPLIKKR